MYLDEDERRWMREHGKIQCVGCRYAPEDVERHVRAEAASLWPSVRCRAERNAAVYGPRWTCDMWSPDRAKEEAEAARARAAQMTLF